MAASLSSVYREHAGGEYDVAIVGGSAGFAAVIKAADLGAQVALAEGGTLCGSCVNVGCVPSKTLRTTGASICRTAARPICSPPLLAFSPQQPRSGSVRFPRKRTGRGAIAVRSRLALLFTCSPCPSLTFAPLRFDPGGKIRSCQRAVDADWTLAGNPARAVTRP
ncbi:MAG: FAD-dependent oxidoreductase [Gemmatimonadetes bacterium]|nr:FAD-dependent oxidoreductase [Gemmatimonadota bacterium]